MLAPISIVGRTAARRDLHVLSHARSGECDKHFGWFRSVARRAPHTDGCYWVERDAAGVEPAHGREKVASMAKICASRRSILARPILSACSLAGPRGISINPSERGEIGPDLFRAACRMGLEGLVSKRRSKHWMRVKNRQHPAFDSGDGSSPVIRATRRRPSPARRQLTGLARQLA